MSILTMEAFSLLKLWRNIVSDTSAGEVVFETDATNSFNKAMCGYEAHNQAMEVDSETEEEEDSFFELVFTVPEYDGNDENISKNVQTKSKSDKDLLKSAKKSKGRKFPLEPHTKPLSLISLLRSAPKFRIFMFGFGKSKLEKTVPDSHFAKHQQKKSSTSEHFTVKCEVEEIRIASLFARDRSLKNKLQKESLDKAQLDHTSKRSPTDVVHKYMKLIKPLYVRLLKRYTDKVKFSDPNSTVSPSTSPASVPRRQTEEKLGSRTAGFRVVCKHLGKSRSASSVTGVVQSPVSRTDDSLVQHHDGIQSAILHCKSSYNARRDCSLLSRSTSDPWHDKTIHPPRFSADEEKRSSI